MAETSTHDPYAPPTATVADVEPAVVGSGKIAFFPVSLFKLFVLSICTFSLYDVCWFYWNWKLIRYRENADIMPVARALFTPLFCYACFARIRKHGIALGINPPLAAGWLAAGWIVATVMWKMPDPFWLITYLAPFFMLVVQAYVNRINAAEAPGHEPNDRFSAWNWVAIVLGGIVLFLALVGAAVAQQVYKSIGPDGRTIYSERPPTEGKVEKTLQYAPQPATPLSNSYVEQLKRFQASSPTVVSVPAGRPVLYSAAWCGYCKLAKAFMAGKGIGFTEFDIDTKEGLAAFASAGGGKGIPLLTYGSARVQGFSQASYESVFAKAK